MLIAVVAVDVVQSAVHQVIRVITMGECFVTAARCMLVGISVGDWAFSDRHFSVDGELVLDRMAFDNGMHVAIMCEVQVAVMLDFRVAATSRVLVVMLLVLNGFDAESEGSADNNTHDRN